MKSGAMPTPEDQKPKTASHRKPGKAAETDTSPPQPDQPPSPREMLERFEDLMEADLPQDLMEEERPPEGVSACRPNRPPVLPWAEAALEERLDGVTLPEYRDWAWHCRTREFMNEWDRQRRRNLGILKTYFSDFTPRWELPEWEHFNQARRQADNLSARYDRWIATQFQRVAKEGRNDVLPRDLAGQAAEEAYRMSLGTPGARRQSPLGPPPFNLTNFDLRHPEHVDYVRRVLDRIEDLAATLYEDDPQGPARLAAEAVLRGKLPEAALELKPGWKAILEQAKRDRAASDHAQGPAHQAARVSPPVII